MRRLTITLALSLLFLLFLPTVALAAVSGHYLEARTADVYTGPCFANSEVGLTGREAVLAWRIDEGTWDGVDLSGLAAVAVVRTAETLGAETVDRDQSRAILYVDQGASVEQRDALTALARAESADLITEFERVETVSIETAFDLEANRGMVRAGEAHVETRGLTHADHLCGNETVYYPPLVDGTDVDPAVAVAHSYSGDAFDGTWSSPGKRSAFVGTFARP